jgi:hypothetical protein
MPFRAITVTENVTRIVSYDVRRRALTIANDAGAKIFLSHNRVNILEEGFPLDVGEKISFSKERGDDTELELNAQAPAGLSADVRIYEAFTGE